MFAAGIDHLGEGQVSIWQIGLPILQFTQILTAIKDIVLPMDFCNVYSGGGRTRRAEYLLELVLSAVLYFKKELKC